MIKDKFFEDYTLMDITYVKNIMASRYYLKLTKSWFPTAIHKIKLNNIKMEI